MLGDVVYQLYLNSFEPRNMTTTREMLGLCLQKYTLDKSRRLWCCRLSTRRIGFARAVGRYDDDDCGNGSVCGFLTSVSVGQWKVQASQIVYSFSLNDGSPETSLKRAVAEFRLKYCSECVCKDSLRDVGAS